MDNETDAVVERRRETQLRRRAAGMGLAVRKSHARDPMRMDHGHYKIVNPTSNYIVAGGFPYGYSLTLDAVEEVLDELEAGRMDADIKKQWLAAHGSGGEIDAKFRRDGR